jgi:hypothetical protein
MHIIYACDIGSTLSKQPGFAWVRMVAGSNEPPAGNQNIDHLAERLRHDLAEGAAVALGFEAPLFIPVPKPDSSASLSRPRIGEEDRSWSASAGAYVTTLALHQAAWLLQAIAPARPLGCAFTVDASHWSPVRSGPLLFCWEAFVSKNAHAHGSDAQPHLRDAATAAVWFQSCESELASHHAVQAQPCLSLIGAAALWSRWQTDTDVLHKEALVLRPTRRYEGPIVQL